MKALGPLAVAMLIIAGCVVSARAGAPLPDADLDRTTAAGRIEAEPPTSDAPGPSESPSPGPQDPRGRLADGRALPPQPLLPIPPQTLLPLGAKNLFENLGIVGPAR